MAKTSGGIRGGGRRSSNILRQYERDASSLFSNITNNYGRTIDYSGYQTKRLQSLQRLGRSYNPREQEKAIHDYVTNANRVTGGDYRSINHASLSGIRSELINTAHRASAYRNLEAISEELKRRRQR